jgi:hypothetical protein
LSLGYQAPALLNSARKPEVSLESGVKPPYSKGFAQR